MKRSVNSFLGTGIHTPIGKYKIAYNTDGTVAKLPIGMLVGFNEHGELVRAEGEGISSANAVRPVGIITDGSVITIDDPRYLPNGKDYKESGDFQEIYMQFKILNVENCWVAWTGKKVVKWDFSQIGKSVYLYDGEMVVDLNNISAGQNYIKIGTLGDPIRKEILCTLDGEIVTKPTPVTKKKNPSKDENKTGGADK